MRQCSMLPWYCSQSCSWNDSLPLSSIRRLPLTPLRRYSWAVSSRSGGLTREIARLISVVGVHRHCRKCGIRSVFSSGLPSRVVNVWRASLMTCSTEINNEESLAQDIPLLTQPRDYNYHHDNSVVGQAFADQSLSFLDFDLMANELFDVTDGLVPGWGVQ